MTEADIMAKIEAAIADTPPPGNEYDDIPPTKYWDEGMWITQRNHLARA